MDDKEVRLPNIMIMGVGGAGNKILKEIVKKNFSNVKFSAVAMWNFDLLETNVKNKILLNVGYQRWSEFPEPDQGAGAAKLHREKIKDVLSGTKLLLLVAGLGRESGSGATPVIAAIAKEMGIRVIAFVSLPFSFEGEKCRYRAEIGFNYLTTAMNEYVIFPNDKLIELGITKITFSILYTITNNMMVWAIAEVIKRVRDNEISNLSIVDIVSSIENIETWKKIGKGERT